MLVMTAIPSAWAADLSLPAPPAVEEVDELIVVRPVRRVTTTRYACVRCSRLPLGGLRKPYVAHVPLGGLRKACPPAVVETIREPVVLRVKG
ncbi:hypothetical protein AA309_16715 [Microvirga vignae]|uniref:Uncharacterized protein n=2 Tax=Microvirga vignae TaxID=1225564 RepID=A0A0H1RHI1_9HYPH|nr:hypothetical protein AA309_16715 [Microvirga vignae]